MRKMSYCVAALVLVAVTSATAAPAINSAVFNLNYFEDCIFHTVTTNNNYSTEIWIDDEWTQYPCGNFANLHLWRLSENGTDAALFANADAFRVAANLVITGSGASEAGLQISPWWSESDGRFNVRSTDGEIACFGGRLPFYSFTANHGVNYVKGDSIWLEMVYHPNGLSMADPATIEYNLNYGGMFYTSGELSFDEGNPSEDPPYGLWGILNDAQVGGYIQALIATTGDVGDVRATWSDIEYEADPPTATENSSWGEVKTLFR